VAAYQFTAALDEHQDTCPRAPAAQCGQTAHRPGVFPGGTGSSTDPAGGRKRAHTGPARGCRASGESGWIRQSAARGTSRLGTPLSSGRPAMGMIPLPRGIRTPGLAPSHPPPDTNRAIVRPTQTFADRPRSARAWPHRPHQVLLYRSSMIGESSRSSSSRAAGLIPAA